MSDHEWIRSRSRSSSRTVTPASPVSRSASVPASGFASRTTTRSPRCSASVSPRQAATVVLPTPPLIDIDGGAVGSGERAADAVQQRAAGQLVATGPRVDQAAGPPVHPASPAGRGQLVRPADERILGQVRRGIPRPVRCRGPARGCPDRLGRGLEPVAVVVPPGLRIRFDAPRHRRSVTRAARNVGGSVDQIHARSRPPRRPAPPRPPAGPAPRHMLARLRFTVCSALPRLSSSSPSVVST